jgi:hypothetical protein
MGRTAGAVGDVSENIVMADKQDEPGIVLTDAQKRARRSRSIAIGVALGALVILFYAITLVKGPGVLVRPL